MNSLTLLAKGHMLRYQLSRFKEELVNFSHGSEFNVGQEEFDKKYCKFMCLIMWYYYHPSKIVAKKARKNTPPTPFWP